MPETEEIQTIHWSIRHLGWLGNVFLVVGLVTAGNQWRWAFLFTAIGEALWTVKLLRFRHWDMLFVTVLFLILSLRNLFVWLNK